MSQKIKVANIEITSGEKDGTKWTRIIVVGDDGSKLNTFEPAASSLQAGDIIEGEIEVKGKYTNLKSFKVVEKATIPTTPEVKMNGYHRDEGQQISIERQVSAKLAVELLIASKAEKAVLTLQTIADGIVMAERFYQWIHNGTLPKLSVNAPETSQDKQEEALEKKQEQIPSLSPDKAKKRVELLQLVMRNKGHGSPTTAEAWVRQQGYTKERIDLEAEKVMAELKEKNPNWK